MSTFLAPSLRALRAASMAVFPPPITITLFPISTSFPSETSVRKVVPSITPLNSSPGIRKLRVPQHPIPRKTALYPSARRLSQVKSFPSKIFVFTSIPS